MSAYLTLPSNVLTFAENTATSYKVKIPKVLSLERGKWEIGLADIQYPSSWTNVPKGTLYVEVTDNVGAPARKSIMEVYVRVGKYDTITELVMEIGRALNTYKPVSGLHFGNCISLYYDDVRNSVLLAIKERRLAVKFSDDLAQLLGYSPHVYRSIGSYTSEHAPDITGGLTSLYVYMSLVEPRIVGDILAPLLRVVPVSNSKRFKNIYQEFANVQYHSIGNTSTDTVEVLIRRNTGEEVPFTSGEVILTVHLKESS